LSLLWWCGRRWARCLGEGWLCIPHEFVVIVVIVICCSRSTLLVMVDAQYCSVLVWVAAVRLGFWISKLKCDCKLRWRVIEVCWLWECWQCFISWDDIFCMCRLERPSSNLMHAMRWFFALWWPTLLSC
jgi:hypothetical protein